MLLNKKKIEAFSSLIIYLKYLKLTEQRETRLNFKTTPINHTLTKTRLKTSNRNNLQLF